MFSVSCTLCVFSVVRGLSIILMSSREHHRQISQYDWHDFEPCWWGLAVNRGCGGFLAVNARRSTQPGRLMVLTASAQWLGIRGWNWVEPKYGHFRQLLLAGANHMISSPSSFQLFATSGKDTWISHTPLKLLWNTWLLLSVFKRFLQKNQRITDGIVFLEKYLHKIKKRLFFKWGCYSGI